MSLRNFVEDHNSDKVEPTEKGYTDFDFETVEAAFSEQQLTSADSQRLQRAIAFILDWLLKVDLNNHHALKSIGKRTVAMGWVVSPERFKRGDAMQSPSLRQLSKQLGITAPAMAPLTSEFSRLTKLTNRFQLHDSKNQYHAND